MPKLTTRKRNIVVTTLVAGALLAALAPATARPLRHRHAHASRHAPAYAYAPRGYSAPRAYGYGPSAADDPYNPYAAPGAALRALARQNQNAPGVTNELAPDNIATATGGPSGGVPGFSGH